MIIKNNKTTSALYKGTKEIVKRYKGTLVVYEAFKKLIASGVPPITLQKCKNANLIDYKIYGNSVQDIDTSNIWDKTYTTGTYYDENGNIVSNSSIAMSNLLPLKYSIYDITCTAYEEAPFSYNFRFNFFDENEKWLSQIIIPVAGVGGNVATVEQEITIPKNAKYINFSVLTKQIGREQKICASTKNTPTPDTPIEIESMGIETSTNLSLPSEYQQVEYIEGTGTQYLVIDYIASGNTKTKGKFKIMDTSKGAFLFGSRDEKGEYFYGLNWGGGIPYKYYNSYYYGTITNKTIDNEIHTFYKDKGDLYIDDVLTLHINDKAFTTPSKMNVFGCYNGVTKGYLPAIARIYDLQFYDEDILKVDLIPCYRKSDNVIGMYDLVNNKFYINQGTGAFLKGKNKSMYKIPVKVSGKITNIYLNEPLRKINDYADYVDFEKGKVIRKIYNQYITEVYGKSSLAGKYTIFLSEVPKKPYMTNNNQYGFAISNKFKTYINPYGQLPNNANSIQSYITTSGGARVAYTFDDSSINTVELAQEKIGDGFEVNYVVADGEEITEDITLPNIPLNKGTNIIEVDTNILPSNIEVKYYGKTKLLLLNETENIILNDILADDTETELDITDTEINQILDEIIGG